MGSAVERHDQILRREIEEHHGYVFKTVGDAFCAAFERAEDAVTAAIDSQRHLAEEDFSAVDGLRVRMGIHIGQSLERSGDYFGPEVNRVARLMSIGHGGQVLISDAARDHVESNLPSDASLVDLGLRRLRDLTLPERVWQITIAGLRAEFPPLDSLDARPNNLPVQISSLMGRDRDLLELKGIIGKHRLVTITGSGGVGKTRIALQLGADLIDHFDDGVWFADISSITDSELVASVVASVLGIDQIQGQRVGELIPQRLKRKKLLLIIDNCEHLVSAVAALVDAIHRTAPDVRILATSRQTLGITGEAAYRLPSLAVPEAEPAPTAAEALQYGAVAVFTARASLVHSQFAVTDENAPTVAEICRRLDGIPLAIELAAARVRVLSIQNLAQRLTERFRLLTGGSRTALPRQKTLAALIDWSYDLLTQAEQELFARLSIFAGGFTLDAASVVCGQGKGEIEMLDLVSSLADKSLVVADTAGAQERYRLLESTRAYALEKIAARGQREPLARRHAEYFRDLAQAADRQYYSRPMFASVREERDLDNYRAALQWSLTQNHDDAIGGALAGALGYLWRFGGLAGEGRAWIALALGRVSEVKHPHIAARLWRAQANLSSGKGRLEAAERALVLYESTENDLGAAWTRRELAYGHYQMGHLEEAEKINAQALETFAELGDNGGIAEALGGLAGIARSRGDTRRARDLYSQAVAAYALLGDEVGIGVLGNIAELEFQEGHHAEAVRLATKLLDIIQREGNLRQLAIAHINLAAYRIATNDLDGSRDSARQGLRCAQEVQDSFGIAVLLQHLAVIAAQRADGKRAARLLGYVDAQFAALGYQRETTEQWTYNKLMTLLRQALTETEIKDLAAQGVALSEDQALEEALKV